MTYPYMIDRRGYGCAAFRNGLHLDVSGFGSREPRIAIAGLLAEHFALGDLDLQALRHGSPAGGVSVARVLRLAGDLADVVASRHESFQLDPAELDRIIALQARCWMPGDHVWIPSSSVRTGWVAGHVEEVRITRDGTTVFVAACTDSGLTITGSCSPEQLAHRSKGGRPPWKA